MGDYLNALSNARGPNGTAEVEKHRNEYIAYGGVTVNPDGTTSVLGKIVSSYDRKTKDALLKQGGKTLDPAPRNMKPRIQNNQIDRFNDYCDIDIGTMENSLPRITEASSPGYIDFSTSFSAGFVNLTIGKFWASDGTSFPYVGLGIGTTRLPGVSMAITTGDSTVSAGYSSASTVGLFGVSVQGGVGLFGEAFGEIGYSGPNNFKVPGPFDIDTPKPDIPISASWQFVYTFDGGVE